MKFKTLFYFLFQLCFFGSVAQQRFANEWINYQQTYFKIPVVQNGIYRITTDELRKAGFPVATTGPTSVQLFFRGQEQAIFISGEADKKWDDADFLEFYGQGNDGTQDSLLYIPNNAQPHKIYNLYSDSTAYFLTLRLDGQAGKRMAFYQESNGTNLLPEAYHREDLLVSNIKSSNYEGMSEGLMYPLGSASGAQMAYYDFGEGWTGPEISKNEMVTKELMLENVVRSGFKPQLEVHLMGRDHRRHQIEVMAGNSSSLQRTLETAKFEYQYPYLSKAELEFSDIAQNGKLWVSTVSRGADATQSDDVYAVTYYRLNYPQQFNFQGKTQKYFNTLKNTVGKSYVEIPNVSSDARLFDLSNKNEIVRIGTTIENGTLKAIVRNTTTERNLFLTRTPLSVLGIQKIGFRNIDATKHNYLVITHPKLYNASKNYAAYRRSTKGGSYDTLVVTMDLLVNQFNYGEFSPLAIRRFVQFMADKGNPKFLFIIGRTQQPDFTRTAPDRYIRDMVPTYGWPGSDHLFSAGLKGFDQLVPAVPSGRLWTDSPQTVLDYLEKVKEHEATKMDVLWRKNVLHLSGGISVLEQKLFKGYMDEFKNKAKRKYLGANVTTISKKTDEGVEYVGLANELNDGAGLVTLFGHSSLSVTDIDIGFVTNDILGYRNKGRYPLVYANGCVLGNFTFGTTTYPIDWVGAKDRGSVLFLAHTNLAYSFSLKNYADSFYDVFLGDSTNLSRPFGEVHQRIIQKFLTTDDSPINRADAQELSLQGDPAIIVFPTKQPDYALTNKDILVGMGQNVTALTDSIQVKTVISNFGLFQNKSLKVKLVRTSKDGTVQSFEKTVAAVAYQDTVVFMVPNERTQTGQNRFDISLDPDNRVVEMNESNNTASTDFNIPTLGAYPLIPAEYAILPVNDTQPNINLIAQAVDNQTRNYTFELDTTASFTSAFKQTQVVSSNWLPNWKVNLLAKDSTTYYWRVRYADRPVDDNNLWAESSFTYLKNSSEGWVQRQPNQFSKAQLSQLNLSSKLPPTWSYQNTSVPIKAVLTGNSVGGFAQGYLSNQLKISDILLVANGNCGNNTIIATAMRRSDLRAYSVFSTYNCGNPPYITNALPDVQIYTNGLLEKYLDAVPKGDYVLLMTSGNIQFDKWPASTKQKLLEMGVSVERLAEMRSGRPYLLIGQKGAKTLAKEILTDPEDLAPSLRTVVLDNFELKSTAGNGQIVSTIIGPTTNWAIGNGQWTMGDGQTVAFNLSGLDLQGKSTELLSNQSLKNLNLSKIDALKYPYLKITAKLNNSEPSVLLPAQLRQWIVNYLPVAEGSANSNIIGNITKQEGESFVVKVSFKNVSDKAFRDSILVNENYYQPNGQKTILQKRIKKLQPNEETSYDIKLETLGKVGSNRIVVNFNPHQQPEQTYTNNDINIAYTVEADKTPPTMDVFFDGRHIRDREVVSAKPFILVQLKDENKFLFKRDTTGLELFLQSPNQSSLKRISFDNQVLKFIPANADNLYSLEFRPQTLADGVYTLRVQGADANNNRTGVYTINFKVINSQQVIDASVYPNPASNYMWFNLVVSGSEKPDLMKVMLYDMNGRLVKTIEQPARVGTNEWLLKDIDLHNGTYIYYFFIQKNNQDISVYDGKKISGKVLIMK